ncbi:MAG: hypothetical protein GWP08_04650 [Nitrospiraceae bacterium]|nr:hypothetical protein [Nitrospiraceae bacterium]
MTGVASCVEADKIRPLPKVLLHVHLEGSIPMGVVRRLMAAYDVHFPCDLDPAEMRRYCKVAGWPGFKAMFRSMIACMRTREDITDIVAAYGRALAASNVRYAEVHVSPWKHVNRGMDLDMLRDGLLDGLALLSEQATMVRFIIDILRHPTENLSTTAQWMNSLPRDAFVGVGISGGPASLPRALYKDFCEKVREMGYPVVAHAGELEGPTSIVEALELLGVRRICHGVQAAHETSLMSRLSDSGVHCELCPTANETLGVEKPGLPAVARMIRSGVSCSVNPDDETIFDTDVTREVVRLAQEGIISVRDAWRLQRDAIEASFAPSGVKSELLAELAPAWTAVL